MHALKLQRFMSAADDRENLHGRFADSLEFLDLLGSQEPGSFVDDTRSESLATLRRLASAVGAEQVMTDQKGAIWSHIGGLARLVCEDKTHEVRISGKHRGPVKFLPKVTDLIAALKATPKQKKEEKEEEKGEEEEEVEEEEEEEEGEEEKRRGRTITEQGSSKGHWVISDEVTERKLPRLS